MKSYPTVEECLKHLSDLHVGNRAIDRVVLHHTAEPNHSDWQGDRSADGVLAYWKQRGREMGYTHPLGAHFIVAPGSSSLPSRIYVPFGDLSEPLNANSDMEANRHGVAIEMVGFFDIGHDVLRDPQKHAAVGLLAGLCVRFGLGSGAVWFHRSYPRARKTCPGTSLSLSEVHNWVDRSVPWARSVME